MNGKSSHPLPAARGEGLVFTEAGTDVLVYDLATHHLHHLNETMTVLWRLCDGRRTVTDLHRDAQLQLGAELTADAVRGALSRLADADLFAGGLDPALYVNGPSRRRLLKRAALAGAAATLVSITAPMAASAQSCLPPGAFCDLSNFFDCCSQACRLTTPEGIPVNQCL